MSQVSDGRGGPHPPSRIGPRLAVVVVVVGILLLMGFSIAVGQWASNPGLSVVAGTAAITLLGWVIKRVVTDLVPDRNGSDDRESSDGGA